MSKKDDPTAFRPFADSLKGVKVARKKDLPPAVSKAVAAAAAKPTAPEEIDESDFLRAMSGVAKLDRPLNCSYRLPQTPCHGLLRQNDSPTRWACRVRRAVYSDNYFSGLTTIRIPG